MTEKKSKKKDGRKLKGQKASEQAQRVKKYKKEQQVKKKGKSLRNIRKRELDEEEIASKRLSKKLPTIEIWECVELFWRQLMLVLSGTKFYFM